MTASTALAQTATAPPVITSPDDFLATIRRFTEERAIVLSPFTSFGALAPSFGIVTTIVQLNANPDGGEVYDGLPFLNKEKGEVAPAKIGLRKLAEAAGISWRTERSDPRTIPHYWEIKAIASYRGVDGVVVTREASAEWDLRDGSLRLKGWTPRQVEEARKNGLRNAEARAINAAIRECGCGIKQKYTRAELAKPFVVFRVAFQPDMSDPETRRQVTAAALGGTAALYGSSATALPAAQAGGDHAPIHVGGGSTPAAAAQTPAEDRPPTVESVRIVKVEEKPGETNGRKWIRYMVVDSTGSESSTFDEKIATFARACAEKKTWVELSTETKGPHTNLLEIVPTGERPNLPGMDRV
jgi:hypothetical protein